MKRSRLLTTIFVLILLFAPGLATARDLRAMAPFAGGPGSGAAPGPRIGVEPQNGVTSPRGALPDSNQKVLADEMVQHVERDAPSKNRAAEIAANQASRNVATHRVIDVGVTTNLQAKEASVVEARDRSIPTTVAAANRMVTTR